jgi:hypothetical protein
MVSGSIHGSHFREKRAGPPVGSGPMEKEDEKIPSKLLTSTGFSWKILFYSIIF